MFSAQREEDKTTNISEWSRHAGQTADRGSPEPKPRTVVVNIGLHRQTKQKEASGGVTMRLQP